MGKVITQTFTTDTFSWTGLIGAIAVGKVDVYLTFSHRNPSLLLEKI
jgi:hypothetical protein